MNRRQLMLAAASAALLARTHQAFAATYDLIIKGGRVVDPSAGLDAVRDVAIAGGKIVSVEANISTDAAETIDARGKIVAPGLVDIHTHAGKSKEGPPMCLQDGVTAWVDAGTGGADMQRLADLLVDLRRRGVAVVVIEHHMDLIMAIADRIVVIDQGRKLAEGTPAEIQRNDAVLEAYLGRAA